MALVLSVAACSSQSGPRSFQPLSSVEKFVSSADCPSGGLTVATGLDKNDNGVLDADEITRTASVCAGRDGVASLMRLEDEPPGQHCGEGGTRISGGVDDGREGGVAGNGLLEPGEVTGVQYVCNGRPGRDGANAPAALARTEPVASNAACPSGGLVLETGLDDGQAGGAAGNGTLEAGEVRASSYVCNGAQGQPGTPGVGALVETLAVSPGAPECPAGGITVRTGLDDGRNAGTAGDQILQDGEVRDARNVCHGLQGASGFNSLIVTRSEPPGADCAAGGTKVLFGLDDGSNGATQRDGVLDDGEVTSVRLVCNGQDGVAFSSIVSLSPLSAGDSDCYFGGVAVSSGLDDGLPTGTANDGVLDAGEVDRTGVICNGMPGARGETGAAGVSALVQTIEEAAGLNCVAGGIKVIVGLDDGLGNGIAADGTLQAGEVRSAKYICNGASGVAGAAGYNSLVRVTSEPAGGNCAAGGRLLESGLDDGSNGGMARNGNLEAGEATSRSYVCNGSSAQGGVSAGVGTWKDSAAQTLGAVQTVSTTSLSVRSSAGYYYSIGWNGTFPDQQIYYSNAGCTGSMWLNAGTTNVSYRYARYLAYEAKTGNFFVPANADANGLALNVAFNAPALWNASSGVWQCVAGGSNGGWSLTGISRAAAGIPSTVVTPLAIE